MSNIEYHENFNNYVEMIVAHPNYKGLYYDRDKNGKVNWVVTGKSVKGQKRQAWWDKKCKELGVPIQKGCYAKVARMIHPTGMHVCQCCGEKRSIFYEYPTLATLKKLNDEFGLELSQTDYTIREFVRTFCKTKLQLNKISRLLRIPMANSVKELISIIESELINKESTLFSPGAMCNPPDRFNGFHSYALCCRKTKDKGRHDDNMKTYTQDRRAYEEWSDGNYNLANRLMGEFHKQPPMNCPICHRLEKMTADHIGPISLGFCHSTHFAPMCSNCNSSKNNRFTYSDVKKLIEFESKGETVISWHSKYIWDKLKNQISNDIEAKKASSIMVKCHQNILYLFSLIYNATGKDFLSRYLHPEYSLYDYRFENFHLSNLSDMKIIENELDSKNKRKNQERYIRIAFESIEDFGNKDNRKVSYVIDKNSIYVKNIIKCVKAQQYKDADLKLKILIQRISDNIFNIGWNMQSINYDIQDDMFSMAAEDIIL